MGAGGGVAVNSNGRGIAFAPAWKPPSGDFRGHTNTCRSYGAWGGLGVVVTINMALLKELFASPTAYPVGRLIGIRGCES